MFKQFKIRFVPSHFKNFKEQISCYSQSKLELILLASNKTRGSYGLPPNNLMD